MILSRRDVFAGLLAAPALHLAASRAEAADDLQSAIEDATRRGKSFRLPPGLTRTRGLTLPGGAHLVGAPGGSTLRLLGEGPLLRAGRVATLRLEGVAIEGAPDASAKGGLVHFNDIPRLTVERCRIAHAAKDGLRVEGCGGRIAGNDLRDIGSTGVFAIDSVGMEIVDNTITRCGDNGVRVWRWKKGYDGGRVSGNRISSIETRSGGTGENGNGVSVYLADAVAATGNDIRNCAWSCLRNNSGRGVLFSGNVCREAKETAIWAEFAFRDATIVDNEIDGAGAGISMTNLDHGGRGALRTGNKVPNIRPIIDSAGKVFPNQRAIHAEADARVAGNIVDGSPWVGISLGWGPFLQNVAVEDNTIRNVPFGVSFSVAEGAGRGRIAGNRIGPVGKAAIVALRWEAEASGDLIDGCGKWTHIECAGNKRV